MTFQDLGLLVDLLGSLGAFITLIYVAIQLREARKDIKLNSILGVNDSAISIANKVSNSPELAKVLAKNNSDPTSLEDWEKVMIFYHIDSLALAYETASLHVELGGIDADGPLPFAEALCKIPGAFEYWKQTRELHSGPFRTAMDEKIASMKDA